jgi:Bifunctional DNA primase/polymerase, N-terminal
MSARRSSRSADTSNGAPRELTKSTGSTRFRHRDCQVRAPDHRHAPIFQIPETSRYQDWQTGFGIRRTFWQSSKGQTRWEKSFSRATWRSEIRPAATVLRTTQEKNRVMKKSVSSRRAINLEIAIGLATVGLPILPAGVFWNQTSARWRKQPLVNRWQQVATCDPLQIGEWWRAHPAAVPGIELGRAGLLVIDADRHGSADGVAAFQALTLRHGLPVGPVTITAGRGLHYLFRQPEGERFRNRRGRLPQGIDVRGAGGWVVAPGSVRPDGAVWQSATDTPPLRDAFPDRVPRVPDWIANLIQGWPTHNNSLHSREPAAIPASSSRHAAYAKAALARNASDLAAAQTGGRNNLANAIAFRMGRMVARGWIDETKVVDALWQACQTNGLAKEDGIQAVRSTIERGLAAGKSNPLGDLSDR